MLFLNEFFMSLVHARLPQIVPLRKVGDEPGSGSWPILLPNGAVYSCFEV